MQTHEVRAVLNVRDFGARGVAVRAETQICPARVHAGWNPLAELRRTIYRAPADEPSARDTAALQAALDAAADQGGGTVVVPPGDYLTGPLWLRSHVHLHLAPGATLWGSPELADYASETLLSEEIHGKTHLTGRARDIALLNARGQKNIGLSGSGQLCGQGGAFMIPWWRADKSYPLERPWRLLCFQDCEAVTVRDVFITDSCGWTLVFRDCRRVLVDGVRIENSHGPNVDGIDLENTSNATIANCDIFTTDDGICLKSTRPDGVVRNVAVSNCNVRTMCNAFKIGTETLGLVQDVVFHNCTAYNTPTDVTNMAAAVAVCCCDGAQVERLQFENITVRGSRAAFYLHVGRRTRYQAPHRAPVLGRLRDVLIGNLQADECTLPSLACGHPEAPIDGLTLRDITVRGHFAAAAGAADRSPPELPEGYPDSAMYGELPAYGLYLRHVNHLALSRFRVHNANPDDPRPWLAQHNTRAVAADTENQTT
ncbi:MAG: right-handed parallel beta-helix repeat-containing protein [Candidatus Marinimicrobia bacterium]|nr:right-handed parallel beta-helix repeat-containing protein [Candidatus Neomarinimicrobiota bacterium]